MPASTSVWSAICGTHLGDTNAVASIARQAGVGEPLDQLDLHRGRHFAASRSAARRAGRLRRCALLGGSVMGSLQPRAVRRLRRPARRPCSGFPSPCRRAGAMMVCSIFIASRMTSGAPFATLAPRCTSTAMTLPGIGAASEPRAGVGARVLRAARSCSVSTPVRAVAEQVPVARRRAPRAPGTSAAVEPHQQHAVGVPLARERRIRGRRRRAAGPRRGNAR